MENEAIAVTIWGEVIGYLSWNAPSRCSVFVYDEHFLKSGWDVAPLGWSIHYPSANMPRHGNKDKLYLGLPPFIADSLPDRWGNRVFDAWATHNGISKRKLTPLDKLSFIGKRGMGALEYEPAQLESGEAMSIPMAELYRLALAIQDERQHVKISAESDILLEDLYRVGTSAGGKRAKAIIAMNAEGDIRSGQAQLPADYVHYLLKFNDDKDFPFSEVEYACYLMACAAGITMMPSRLMKIEGKCHFLTERFDRRNGEKIHVLTLAAMDEEAVSYEDLFAVCRRLRLPENQQKEMYRRMVFNVFAGNVDDHSKNFSFMMDRQGTWCLAPAYDMLFSVDLDAPRYVNGHSLSLNGKTHDISVSDLIDFAERNDISGAKSILDEIRFAVSEWNHFAEEARVPALWIKRISEALKSFMDTV